jgi:hypothetical protein
MGSDHAADAAASRRHRDGLTVSAHARVLLIVTNRADLTADWVIVELRRREARYLRLNTEDYPRRCRIAWRPGEAATLKFSDRDISMAEVTCVWYRRPVAPQLAPGLPPEHAAWVQREAREALDAVWRTHDGRWVSRPEAIAGADSKPLQLRDALALGFNVPDTEITNDRQRLLDLWNRSRHGVVCKPLRHGRVGRDGTAQLLFTSRLQQHQLDDLGDEPHLFQALVPKVADVRATVIGTAVFAARIDSQQHPEGEVDWRRAPPGQLPYAAHELPAEIADGCVRLVQQYGLMFGAIDLALRPDGGYTFFELNPNGQWAWIEQRTGLPLRDHLIDLLLGD